MIEIYTINQAKKNLDKLLDCIDYAGPAYIRSILKLAYDRQMLEAPHRRTGAYDCVRKDSRSGVTTQLSFLLRQGFGRHAKVEFSMKSIVGKNNKTVMLSLEEFNAMKETIYLLSIPGMVDSLQKGIAKPIEECSSTLEW